MTTAHATNSVSLRGDARGSYERGRDSISLIQQLQSQDIVTVMFMYSYCYVYVLLLLLCMFRSTYSVSLCCYVYCCCVNVYWTTATGCQPN
jgi:ABC-type transport system involved in Fe-S cluster assembly fused permease/ATPase subunit